MICKCSVSDCVPERFCSEKLINAAALLMLHNKFTFVCNRVMLICASLAALEAALSRYPAPLSGIGFELSHKLRLVS